ncbi:type III-D CRISPR-associated protein Csx19 [Leptolyngbya sp. AN03gr2]|uniref:type III-D CRISPR-associated protein Csx19 n=1 Tax=unclassified Leptolyngbya TaxID=2650499 RepID=UPI003D320104
MSELEPRITLCSFTYPEVKLRDALVQCSQHLTEATALLYSLESCRFARLSDGKLSDSSGEITLEQSDRIFEARFFNQHYELRWLNQTMGIGTGVLLWECSTPDISNAEKLKAIDVLEQTYVLWGEGTDTSHSEGWSSLAAARIGKFDVPLAGIVAHQQVQLTVKEYLAVCDEYGNVAVSEERLLALEPMPLKQEKKNGR